MNSFNGKTRREVLDFVRFVMPMFILYIIFFILPLIQTIQYSMTDWSGVGGSKEFIGLDNYIAIFKDSLFYNSIGFTLIVAIIYTLLVNVVGLILAMALNRKIKSKNVLRAIIFCPFIFNNVTVGFIWQFILGRLMTDFYSATGAYIFGLGWLSNSSLVLYSVIFVKMWQSMGYFMVIYLAGLQMLPKSPLESALIDGCSPAKRAVYIVVPLLRHTIYASVFLSVSETLNMFPLLMTLTNGGPGHASESISLYIYREAFKSYRMGYASALAVVLTIIVLLIGLLQMAMTKEKDQ